MKETVRTVCETAQFTAALIPAPEQLPGPFLSRVDVCSLTGKSQSGRRATVQSAAKSADKHGVRDGLHNVGKWHDSDARKKMSEK